MTLQLHENLAHQVGHGHHHPSSDANWPPHQLSNITWILELVFNQLPENSLYFLTQNIPQVK